MSLRKTTKVGSNIDQAKGQISNGFKKRVIDDNAENEAEMEDNEPKVANNDSETEDNADKVEDNDRITEGTTYNKVGDATYGPNYGEDMAQADHNPREYQTNLSVDSAARASQTNLGDGNNLGDGDIPTHFTTRDFDSEMALVRHKVSDIITLIDLGEVDKKTLERLANVVDKHREVDFDEEYDMRDELHTMMKLVHAVRSSILTDDNKIARDTTVTEVKAVLDASMRLTQLLTKSNKEIINMDRIAAVEAAFLQVISDMPTEVQKSYVDNLENRMKLMKELSQLAE